MATKRSGSPTLEPISLSKRMRSTQSQPPIRIATSTAAENADNNTPLDCLLRAAKSGPKTLKDGKCVVYWMRLCDLRVSDNKALSRASSHAVKCALPLVAMFVFSVQELASHHRSPRRVDFTLRNLEKIKISLASLNIPLHVTIHDTGTVAAHVMSLFNKFNAVGLFANIQYEVDELRTDIALAKGLAKDVQVSFFHDRCVVDPGDVKSKEGKNYAMYSPFQKTWLTKLNANHAGYLENCPVPSANSQSIHESELFSSLFHDTLPTSIPGFELEANDKEIMEKVWPAGEDIATQILDRFLKTRSRTSQFGSVDPLAPEAQTSTQKSRVHMYKDERDLCDQDTTSRLSPYLAAGVLSARACIRAVQKNGVVDGGKTTGIGRWVQEIAWRDFYITILAICPRVSMGRTYNNKFDDVKWEYPDEIHHTDSASSALQRWKDGNTGVPIVDAAMRCINQMGWTHNRLRMISAMYLTKELMIDWRLGEKYFMEKLIDGDLASNNGGWQWIASTGVDAVPYFRIFNPYTQSLKADPKGDFIRYYVPELSQISDAKIHNRSAAAAKDVSYPLPVIEHGKARERALRRYKNPGTE